MEIHPQLNAGSEVPLYRQVAEYLRNLIDSGGLRAGDRLPPTRELAAQIGLNRTTISAAYASLEAEGLIKGEVGRGSFVSGFPTNAPARIDWTSALTPAASAQPRSSQSRIRIDFTSSRPAAALFPLAEFQACCRKVLESPELPRLLQLGSPGGYEPLRRHLLDRGVQLGFARSSDSILVTNGCQQAIDLLGRALLRPGDKVAVEEPVYPGLRNAFLEAGAQLIGMRMTAAGADLDDLRVALNSGAKVVVITPSFQNPTGATIPESRRAALVEMVRTAGAVLIENDLYSELRYEGPHHESGDGPRLKSHDPDVILLGSFSKIAFPGARVGWIVGPRPLIARVTELKQVADLHTDQLSQAFLLEFAKSGALERHRARAVTAGREKLQAVATACARHLRGCSISAPEGGMNVWVELPAGMDAAALRGIARQAGVDFLPGRYFSIARPLDQAFRLSFAGLEPDAIEEGIEILGSLIAETRPSRDETLEPEPALV
jgi:DNA-binding transcriptional MocR family regulator